MAKIGSVDLKWLGHSGFLIQNSKNIYVDPYNIKEGFPKADFVLITHSHYDHCSLADLKKIVKEGTRILMTADCQSVIARIDFPVKMEIVEPNQEFDFRDFKVLTVKSYNIDKHFHPKEEGWVGYVLKFNDVIIYHSGDCDIIPEMKNLTGFKQPGKTFVALLPIGGRFTMNPEEAFHAARIIKPSMVVPMHWGSVVGGSSDAMEFAELCTDAGIKVLILDKE